MFDRTGNPRNPSFRYYGGRGITVCNRWRSFENFLADMGQRPAGKSIDRIDNDGNYEPGNCRWATRVEQMRNTRRSRSIAAAAEAAGVKIHTVETRLARGWNLARALSIPSGQTRNQHTGKTHCPRGHEYTPENTIIRRTGWRECRTCRREVWRPRTG